MQPWLLACFGAEIAAGKVERNHRFTEEALELVQALGMPAADAHALVEYVYSRPAGEPGQEVGGVMTTLAALCLANGLDMHAEAETELARIWTKVDAIRAKQATKPKGSALPMAWAVQEPAWQPIETAPRDGSRVLIYKPEDSRQKVLEAYWATPWDGAPDEQCWWSMPHGPAGRGYMILQSAVTHWMPLPAAPQPVVEPPAAQPANVTYKPTPHSQDHWPPGAAVLPQAPKAAAGAVEMPQPLLDIEARSDERAERAAVLGWDMSLQTPAYPKGAYIDGALMPEDAYAADQLIVYGKACALAAQGAAADAARYRATLEYIVAWSFPPTGEFWDDEKTRPMSFGVKQGSNGERDYMRRIARAALKQTGKEPS